MNRSVQALYVLIPPPITHLFRPCEGRHVFPQIQAIKSETARIDRRLLLIILHC